MLLLFSVNCLRQSYVLFYLKYRTQLLYKLNGEVNDYSKKRFSQM